jgi:ADP-ribose pyrophosphatase YjhB (NUDIX family)
MHYYLETDGKVFIINRNGQLDLPKLDEVPFEFEAIAPLATTEPVLFCIPSLARHPQEWWGKDELAFHSNSSKLLLQAVHSTMQRVVVEAICIKEGKILLVKGSRGLTKGRWSLPGGFLRFGEEPTDGILREVGEELRTEGKIESFLECRGKIGETSKLHWIMLFYLVSLSDKPDPDPDEIAEARYFPLGKAASLLQDGLMRQVVVDIGAAS